MSQPYPIRLALFFGGVSSEHEVSCVSAAAWLRALALPPCANKYEVTAVGITKDGRWLRYGGPAARVEDGSWQTDTEALTPCVLSPDRADRGLLIRQGDGCAVQPVDVCVPVLHGKTVRTAPSRACSRWQGFRLSAPECWPAPPAWTKPLPTH